MTTRDPRSRDVRPAQAGVRDPTQSLSLPPQDDDERDSHPSLAMGSEINDERTKVESPNAKVRTPAPAEARPSSKPPPLPRKQTDDAEDRIGAVLGSYRVLEVLGKGGMGFVYRAEHTKLGREVAIKLLRSDYARRRDAVARFIQEARTVNRIRHRNIVDVPDIVELDDGTTFIVMEFLRGDSLGKWARTGVDLPRALAVLVQICDGLAAAHSVNIVHRDLKPDNVIVVPTSDGAELVKLLDFGVAKLLNRDDEDVGFQTAAGSVIGTPAYMSPEQAGGMAVDARSDIYSLGAIMYELFCGQPMFRGRSFGEYVRKHLTERPVPPRQTQGGAMIDSRLELLIMKALEKDPVQRFTHITELRDALLSMLGGLDTHPPFPATATMTGARPALATLLPPAVPIMATPQSGVMHPSQFYNGYSQVAPVPPSVIQERATPMWAWLVGGALAIGLGIGGALWFASRGDAPAAATATPPVVAAKPAIESTPIAPEAKPARFVELKFDSLPEGGVFEDGHSAELCRTPCSFNLDLQDGGSTDKRVFVIRATSYRDARVPVILGATQREFVVTLEHLPVAGVPQVDKRHPAGKKPIVAAGKKPEIAAPPDEKPAPPPVTEAKPTPKPTAIDASETLDPFHRKN
jgi:serine/threonine protein kinase